MVCTANVEIIVSVYIRLCLYIRSHCFLYIYIYTFYCLPMLANLSHKRYKSRLYPSLSSVEILFPSIRIEITAFYLKSRIRYLTVESIRSTYSATRR
jgi:hypothetical protein